MTQWGIDTLFNPGKRHMDEEKRRLQATREEVGDSSGGRRIDLESGTVRITRPKAETGEDADGEDANGEDAGGADAGGGEAVVETDSVSPDSDGDHTA